MVLSAHTSAYAINAKYTQQLEREVDSDAGTKGLIVVE
jgi:hypothetical protein